MHFFRTGLLLLLSVPGFSVWAEVDEDDIREMLQHRWFDVEVIIFERMDTLEYNTIETLTAAEPPVWTSGMVEYEPFTGQSADSGSEGTFEHSGPLTERLYPEDVHCIGFPTLAEADELHPILTALLEGDDTDTEFIADDSTDFLTETGQTPVEAGQSPAETAQSAETGQLPAENPQAIAETSQSPAETSVSEKTPMDLFAEKVAAFEADLISRTFTWSEETTLEPSLRAINRQSHLRPLFHQKWRQAVPPRKAPSPVRIDLPAEAPRLRGTIALTVARYLHMDLALWYETPGLGQTPRILGPDGASQMIAPTQAYIHISDHRRMRSQELHYIDHPKVGILVYVDPLPIPEALVTELTSLRSTETLN